MHGERSLYESGWVSLSLVDVEVPGLRRFEHHVVRSPRPAAGVVVADPERGVLLLWRHRFITGSWGWELPAGGVDASETVEQGAAREVLEETGWRPGPLTLMQVNHPMNGLSDTTFHLFLARSAVRVGDPTDPSESERVEWLTPDRVREVVRAGEVTDGLSLGGLLWWLAFEQTG